MRKIFKSKYVHIGSILFLLIGVLISYQHCSSGGDGAPSGKVSTEVSSTAVEVARPGKHRIFFVDPQSGGAFLGVQGADNLCDTEARRLGYGSSKAIIVDGQTRVACINAYCNPKDSQDGKNWVLQPNAIYYLANDSGADLVVGQTNAERIFISYSNDIINSALIPDGRHFFFSGLAFGWQTGFTCKNWTSLNPDDAGTAGSVVHNGGSTSIHWVTKNCAEDQLILCVEQGDAIFSISDDPVITATPTPDPISTVTPVAVGCDSPGTGDQPFDYYHLPSIVAHGKSSNVVAWSSTTDPRLQTPSAQNMFVTDSRFQVRVLAYPSPGKAIDTYNNVCTMEALPYTKLQVKVGMKLPGEAAYFADHTFDINVNSCSPSYSFPVPPHNGPLVVDVINVKWDYSCTWDKAMGVAESASSYCPWGLVWAHDCYEIGLQIATDYTKEIPTPSPVGGTTFADFETFRTAVRNGQFAAIAGYKELYKYGSCGTNADKSWIFSYGSTSCSASFTVDYMGGTVNGSSYGATEAAIKAKLVEIVNAASGATDSFQMISNQRMRFISGDYIYEYHFGYPAVANPVSRSALNGSSRYDLYDVKSCTMANLVNCF